MEKPYSHIYEEVEVIKGTNTLEVLLVLKKDTKEFLVAKKANIYELTEGEQDEVFNEVLPDTLSADSSRSSTTRMFSSTRISSWRRSS